MDSKTKPENLVRLCETSEEIGYTHALVDATKSYNDNGDKGIQLWLKHGKYWRKHLEKGAA